MIEGLTPCERSPNSSSAVDLDRSGLAIPAWEGPRSRFRHSYMHLWSARTAVESRNPPRTFLALTGAESPERKHCHSDASAAVQTSPCFTMSAKLPHVIRVTVSPVTVDA